MISYSDVEALGYVQCGGSYRGALEERENVASLRAHSYNGKISLEALKMLEDKSLF